MDLNPESGGNVIAAQNLAEGYTNLLMDIDASEEKKKLDSQISKMTQKLEKSMKVTDQICCENKEIYEKKCPEVFAHYQSLLRIFQNIDNLESMMEEVKSDVNQMEMLVCKAEKDLKIGPNISDVLKPLIFKKGPISPVVPCSNPGASYIHPVLKFSPDNYFPPESSDVNEEGSSQPL